MDELERMPRLELTINQPLPTDIFDEHGRLLLKRGTALEADAVADLRRKRLYRRKRETGGRAGDSAPNGKPSEDANAQPGDDAGAASATAADRRQFPRQQWDAPLSLNVDDHAGGEQQITVNARDVSAGGIGFVADRRIAPGTIIHVRFEDVPDAPLIRSVVRSCVQLPDEQGYRVGIEFVGR